MRFEQKREGSIQLEAQVSASEILQTFKFKKILFVRLLAANPRFSVITTLKKGLRRQKERLIRSSHRFIIRIFFEAVKSGRPKNDRAALDTLHSPLVQDGFQCFHGMRMAEHLQITRKFFFRQLGEDDKYLVSSLRRKHLGNSFTAVSDLNFFNWGPTDRKSHVYGIFHGSDLISSLRLETLQDPKSSEERIEASQLKIAGSWPAGLTRRGVTAEPYRKLGAYSILKLVCLMKSIELGHEFCFATVRKDSFQIPHLRSLGYVISPSDRDWSGFIKDSQPPMICRLNLRTHGFEAVRRIYRKNLGFLSELQWCETLSKKVESLHSSKPNSPM